MPTAVTISGVVAGYPGSAPVLDGLTLEVAAGELFFLLGGSGCGKSTLLRVVAGFHKPVAGTVSFDGQDVTALPAERRGIGMVFQHYALWPHLDVAGNVAFPLEIAGISQAERTTRVAEALALVELAALAHRRIGELSGGQQQRVALARAIVARPRVLLLDEPLSNLDPRLRVGMRQEIRRVCRAAGVTALYVTHDQGEALATADRIALLDRGRVVQVGTPRELYAAPRSAAAARFIGDANVLTPAQAEALAPGLPAAAAWCIRPERLRLVAAGSGIPATVVSGSYEGARAMWTVALADGQRLTVSEADPARRSDGDAIGLTFDRDALIPLDA